MQESLVKNKVLPLLLVVAGLLLGYYILQSGHRKPSKYSDNKVTKHRVVQTSKLVKGSVIPLWNTSGYVVPAETVKIYSRVSGNLISINPDAFPGGLIKKGQWLAKIDKLDFELALQSQKAQLEQAKANLSLVHADQVLAKEELSLLNNNGDLNIDEALVLRQPQLTVANAKISVAQNNVEKAKLDLSRTNIIMPFDGKIITKDIGVGSKVSNNTAMFSVVNSDVYWIEVKIPHKFLNLFDTKHAISLSQPRLWGDKKQRSARFISIYPELDKRDRQVKILLGIDNPLLEQTNEPRIFINDFLNVQLKGKAINNAWTIKHAWLQPDNTIWVVDKNKTLQKRAVEVLFKGRDVIYVNTEIELGDRALAEKPGIASIGLPVRMRKSLADQNIENNKKNKQMKRRRTHDAAN